MECIFFMYVLCKKFLFLFATVKSFHETQLFFKVWILGRKILSLYTGGKTLKICFTCYILLYVK